ncbi:aminotransferase class I/II-fold pyridoxal phosphate-dependent enzyme [Micromonospora sp. D93]|uniref:DegT/DnrJ/EryC1/StrS family aminotransferase n=1 Tax=Micromonospora sp. D93 TaxID=2824886 RepID=UPI001B369C8F|nr:aminotransferase class I/II-fold pyridoxal phosphate-dependent enzyme [Micromonospora sp. D93]MBQ1017230.1 aminotransferase class I/II-fold pyridoxal phosphate-dependent enzyme [Micromonospora sp. D93]
MDLIHHRPPVAPRSGGPAVTDPVYLSPPDIGALEESYLLRAVRAGRFDPDGPELGAFEREVAARVGVGYALGLSSGTAALHMALLAVGAGPDSVVVVPTLTFAATANAVTYTGAEPVFVDCDATTGNLDVGLLSALLGQLTDAGRRVAAVLAVDINGRCVDYDRLLPLCAATGVPVVEDAAQALGSTYRGRCAGSFGRVGIYSFSHNKIMTTSAGGMLVSDDAALVARARHLATQAREPVPHYEHRDVGYNYRLSTLLAALGRAQLSRLDTMIARRRALRDRYARLFASVSGTRILGDGDPGSNCWLTSLVVEPERAGWHAGDLAAHLAGLGVESRPMWKPMHRQPVYADRQVVLSGAADQLFATSLSLPSGSALSDEQVERVTGGITDFLAERR